MKRIIIIVILLSLLNSTEGFRIIQVVFRTIIAIEVAFKALGIKEVAASKMLVITKVNSIFFVNIIANGIYMYYVKVNNRVSINKYAGHIVYRANPI